MKTSFVELCGFRGFREKVRFDLPHGFVVLNGRNGSGKSTVLDAIDFAVYAVRSTVDSIRFIATRSKTVGGPIDVLVIKPREAFWVQRKTLKVQ